MACLFIFLTVPLEKQTQFINFFFYGLFVVLYIRKFCDPKVTKMFPWFFFLEVLTFGYMINFDLIFAHGVMEGLSFHFFAYKCSVVLVYFIEKMILFPLNSFVPCKKSFGCWGYFWVPYFILLFVVSVFFASTALSGLLYFHSEVLKSSKQVFQLCCSFSKLNFSSSFDFPYVF